MVVQAKELTTFGRDTPSVNEEQKELETKDSILNSVKKVLGLLPEMKEFDMDIALFINGAIATLKQLGIGPQDSIFTVSDETQTYEDYLGEDCDDTPLVKQYLVCKTRLMFDPPQSSIVAEAMKATIAETEWRLQAQANPRRTFEEGGEIF